VPRERLARVGLCSWSLRPASPADLMQKMVACGASAVQLALDPIRLGVWDETEVRRALDRSGFAVLSGMMATANEDYSTLETIRRTGGVRPDATWPENLVSAKANARIARRLGLTLITLHAGFLPHDTGDGGCLPERATMLTRLRMLAEVFGEQGIRLGLETGQESAETLLAALRDLAHPNVFVNFDPANMILYGMGDPLAALRKLAPHVAQVHIKDALPTETPGSWGQEVVVGTGAVDWHGVSEVVRGLGSPIDLLVEREAGEQREADIRVALGVLKAHHLY
jgi:L-ribulose-5-phosphate 3-epimerase